MIFKWTKYYKNHYSDLQFTTKTVMWPLNISFQGSMPPLSFFVWGIACDPPAGPTLICQKPAWKFMPVPAQECFDNFVDLSITRSFRRSKKQFSGEANTKITLPRHTQSFSPQQRSPNLREVKRLSLVTGENGVAHPSLAC